MLPVVLALASLGSASAVNKCCPPGERLHTDFQTCMRPQTPSSWPPRTLIYRGALSTEYGIKQPCNGSDIEMMSIDEDMEVLENGHLSIQAHLGNVSFPSDSYCFDSVYLKGVGEHYIVLLCPCQHVTCIKKCCHDGMLLEFTGSPDKNPASCVSHKDDDWEPPITSIYPGPSYFLKHGYPRCKPGRKMYLLRNTFEDEPLNFWFLEDGRVQVKDSRNPIEPSQYCAELTRINGQAFPNLVSCPFDSNNGPEYGIQVFYGSLFTIGAVFLGLTFLVQLALPELRKSVHASSLTAHVGVMLVGYVILAVGNFRKSVINRTLCAAIASTVQFTFLAAFFWLNVMCIDISWTFSGYRIPQARSVVESEKRKFLYYSAYAWGSSIFISGLTLVLDLFPGTHHYFKSNFGRTVCWFEDRIPTLIFFALPIAITLLLNIVLFVYTSYKILQMRKETSILSRNESARYEGNTTRKADEHRFLLYLKLLSIMGITWVFEIISWVNNDKKRDNWLWYIPDTVNALRGFFIFLILCCKKKTLILLKSRFISVCQRKSHRPNSKTRRSGQASLTLSTIHHEMSTVNHSTRSSNLQN